MAASLPLLGGTAEAVPFSERFERQLLIRVLSESEL